MYPADCFWHTATTLQEPEEKSSSPLRSGHPPPDPGQVPTYTCTHTECPLLRERQFPVADGDGFGTVICHISALSAPPALTGTS